MRRAAHPTARRARCVRQSRLLKCETCVCSSYVNVCVQHVHEVGVDVGVDVDVHEVHAHVHVHIAIP